MVLVERANMFTSCPISNLVLAGFTTMDDIRQGYDGLDSALASASGGVATAADGVARMRDQTGRLVTGLSRLEGGTLINNVPGGELSCWLKIGHSRL